MDGYSGFPEDEITLENNKCVKFQIGGFSKAKEIDVNVYISGFKFSTKIKISLTLDIDDNNKTKTLSILVNGEKVDRLRICENDYIEILTVNEDICGTLCLDTATFAELFNKLYKYLEDSATNKLYKKDSTNHISNYCLIINIPDRGSDYIDTDTFEKMIQQ